MTPEGYRYIPQSMAKALKPAEKKNPYTAARAKPPGAVVAAQPDLGQVQPDFANTVSLDPNDTQQLPLPQALRGRPELHPGRPGFEDIYTDKYNQDVGRGRNQNTYQDPLNYETHQNTVMNSKLMQQMAAGLDQEKQLREDYLKTAPVQSDLSPTMALADYIAGKGGTAQAGYQRPASYEDHVAAIRGMLGDEVKGRQNMTTLAMEQAGGLKSGEETAQNKTSSDRQRQQGEKIPHPMMGGMMMPFNQANAFTKNYESNPNAKRINDEIANANDIEKDLASPNWYTNRALAGKAVKNMGFNRMTQAEFFTLGGGSQDLWNRAANMVRKGYNGETLSPTDIQTIQDFNTVRRRAALAARDQLHQAYQQGLGSYLMNPAAAPGLMNQGDVQPEGGAGATNDERANAAAAKILESMKGMMK